jgi:hypothetical protein
MTKFGLFGIDDITCPGLAFGSMGPIGDTGKPEGGGIKGKGRC